LTAYRTLPAWRKRLDHLACAIGISLRNTNRDPRPMRVHLPHRMVLGSSSVQKPGAGPLGTRHPSSCQHRGASPCPGHLVGESLSPQDAQLVKAASPETMAAASTKRYR